MPAVRPSATAAPDELTKRERQVLASVMDASVSRGAFSVRFVHKTSHGRLESTVYLHKPNVQHYRNQQQQQEVNKENVPKQPPACNKAKADVAHSAKPDSPPPPDAPTAKAAKAAKVMQQLQKEADRPGSWSEVVRRQPSAKQRVDKNTLSACGSGNQKRKQMEAEPAKKAGAAAQQPKRSPRSESQDEEFHDALAYGPEDALIERLNLYEEKGQILGHDIETGEFYGGPGRKPVPTRALELYAEGYYDFDKRGDRVNARRRSHEDILCDHWEDTHISDDHIGTLFDSSSDGDWSH